MGTAKAALPWHGSTLLRRTVGVVGRGLSGPVVVVRAAGQPLPSLPASVEVLEDSDEAEDRCTAWRSAWPRSRRRRGRVVCSTDLPFLHPAYLQRVLALRGDADVVLPVVHGIRQPLAAAYRTALADRARALLAQDRARPAFLIEGADVRFVEDGELLADARLRAVDPDLDSVLGVNDPAAYEAACARPQPEVVVHRTGVLAVTGGRAQQHGAGRHAGCGGHGRGAAPGPAPAGRCQRRPGGPRRRDPPRAG
jgi:molybdopterin-guanine dinucleotide biosynthesis protein A